MMLQSQLYFLFEVCDFCVIIKLLKVKFLNYQVKFYNVFYPDPFSLLMNEINVRAGNFYILYIFQNTAAFFIIEDNMF